MIFAFVFPLVLQTLGGARHIQLGLDNLPQCFVGLIMFSKDFQGKQGIINDIFAKQISSQYWQSWSKVVVVVLSL